MHASIASSTGGTGSGSTGTGGATGSGASTGSTGAGGVDGGASAFDGAIACGCTSRGGPSMLAALALALALGVWSRR